MPTFTPGATPLHPPVQSSVVADVRAGFWTLGRSDSRLERHESLGAPRKLFGVSTEDEPAPIMTQTQIGVAAAQKRVVGNRGMLQLSGLRLAQWPDVDSAGMLRDTRAIPAPSYPTIALQTEYRSTYESPGEGTIPLSVQDKRHHSTVDVIDTDSLYHAPILSS